MDNIHALLDELVRRELITAPVRNYMRVFLARMNLQRDISEQDIGSIADQMDRIRSDAQAYPNEEFLSGEFERIGPAFLAEAAILGAMTNEMSSDDVQNALDLFVLIGFGLERPN